MKNIKFNISNLNEKEVNNFTEFLNNINHDERVKFIKFLICTGVVKFNDDEFIVPKNIKNLSETFKKRCS